MHRAALTAQCPAHSQAATAFPPPSSPTGTQHDGTWYPIPCSVWPGWVSLPCWVPSWLLAAVAAVQSCLWYVTNLRIRREEIKGTSRLCL